MSYRVRYTFPDGRAGHWMRDYATREEAQRAIDERRADTGLAYTVDEVPDAPEPGSTAAHHVEILRERVKELEEIQKAIHRDLAFALQLGDAMREAMRTGEWRAGHDRSMANSAIAGWDRWRTGLAASPKGPAKASGWAGGTVHTGPGHQPGAGQGVTSRLIVDLDAIERQGPAKASEAPGEGGDSDRRRLEALERWLKGDTQRLVYFSKRQLLVAVSDSMMDEAVAPTLAALADKLAAEEAKP